MRDPQPPAPRRGPRRRRPEETPRVVPDDLLRGAFTAWGRARRDIFDAWTYETDPAHLQPRVSPFNRGLADFLRDHAAEGVDQARLERCIEAIEAPTSEDVRKVAISERVVVQVTGPQIEGAARIVSGGRGLRSQEGFEGGLILLVQPATA